MLPGVMLSRRLLRQTEKNTVNSPSLRCLLRNAFYTFFNQTDSILLLPKNFLRLSFHSFYTCFFSVRSYFILSFFLFFIPLFFSFHSS